MKGIHGLSESERRKSVQHLSTIVGEEYMLYLKLLNYHWNIEGPQFISLHELLEDHYRSSQEHLDALAERVRQLGDPEPATTREFEKQGSKIKPGDAEAKASTMLKDLVESYEIVIRQLRESIETLDKDTDYATVDLLIEILRDHEKKAWMIASHLH